VTFALTPKQEEALVVCAGPASNVMLEGGSGSAKTFLHCRNIVVRALKSPGSRHGIFRFRFNHVISSIGRETMPDVLRMAFPNIAVNVNQSDWIYTFPGGSEIYLGGLDDKERTEKILGRGLATALLNECSQIPYDSRNMVVTRMRQKVLDTVSRTDLPVRIFYDQNPPSKGHWTYKLFHLKQDPETGKSIPNPQDYAWVKMNPQDNAQNLSADYLRTLQSMSARYRKRFWEGEYSDENPNALFADTTIDKWRVIDGRVPEMVRIVVAVDPSGSGDVDNADNDEIGILAVGLGTDGNAYVMEDNSCKAGPATWGRIAVSTHDRLQGNLVVGEKNFGGAMVEYTIQTSAREQGLRPIPFKYTVSSRGKHLRAEPVAALYEQGKVRHVGYFSRLENEMAGMSTNGYTGQGSPNRLDALVFAVTELFPGLVQAEEKRIEPVDYSGYSARMGFA
jgi:hypothetical protein